MRRSVGWPLRGAFPCVAVSGHPNRRDGGGVRSLIWRSAFGLAVVVVAAGCGSSSSDAGSTGSASTGSTETVLPPTTSTTVSTLPLPGTGARGRVTAGPTCPVEREDQPCPPNPVKRVRIDASTHGRVAGSAVTDDDGRYAITLEPGDYVVHVETDGMFPRCPDTDVHVSPGSAATADIACDTGIR